GDTAYVVVRGAKVSSNNWSNSWVLPSGSVVCANTAGSDRTNSSASGVLPGASAPFLQDRPNTTASGSTWNRESNYETRPCANFAAANEGAWKLRPQIQEQTADDAPRLSLSTAP